MTVIKRGRGRPKGMAGPRGPRGPQQIALQEIFPPEPGEDGESYTVPLDPVVHSKSGARLLNAQEKIIMQVCAMAFCTEGETAAYLRIPKQSFSMIMKRKDPETRRFYRDMWNEWSEDAPGSLKRMLFRQARMMDSAGFQAKKLLAANLLGWTDKSTERHEVTGRIVHEHIPKDLTTLTLKELEDLAGNATAAGKPVLKVIK